MNVTLHYTEALVRRAVRAFWWRSIGWKFIVAIALVAMSLVFSVANGDRSWVVGMSSTALIGALLFGGALYVTHYRSSLGRLRSMSRPEATLELTETHLRVSSDIGTSQLGWSAVTDIWQFDEFWLLFFSRAQFMTLPTADLDSASRQMLLTKTAKTKD
jgi:hypothetical protein